MHLNSKLFHGKMDAISVVASYKPFRTLCQNSIIKSTKKYWKPVQKTRELLKCISSMQPFLQSKALTVLQHHSFLSDSKYCLMKSNLLHLSLDMTNARWIPSGLEDPSAKSCFQSQQALQKPKQEVHDLSHSHSGQTILILPHINSANHTPNLLTLSHCSV